MQASPGPRVDNRHHVCSRPCVGDRYRQSEHMGTMAASFDALAVLDDTSGLGREPLCCRSAAAN